MYASAQEIRNLHSDRPEEAEALMDATVHWLRHTGISDGVKIRPREHARDDAGDSSAAITDKTIDIELKERYWNFETRDCGLAGLDNAVRVFSQGEQNMAQFFRCVWLGSDEDLAVTTSPVGSGTHSSRNGFH